MREKLVELGHWPADDPRDPSESIEAAWELIEKLSQRYLFRVPEGHGTARVM